MGSKVVPGIVVPREHSFFYHFPRRIYLSQTILLSLYDQHRIFLNPVSAAAGVRWPRGENGLSGVVGSLKSLWWWWSFFPRPDE
jgi:hypothetical protein